MDEAAEQRRDELVERLFEATIGTLELFSVHLGWRLGLYAALAGTEALTPDELAERAGIAPRYAREWCEQQAVAGFLQAEEAAGGRRFRLPPEHAPVFTAPDDPSHVAPFGALVVGIAGALPDVVEAYRSGAGVPYERYGRDFRDGQGLINRPAFLGEMANWLAASPEIDSRLAGDPPAHVADVGCGQGYSTVAIARAYPKARVDGFDLDPPSIADAEQFAAGTEVTDRVSFGVRGADTLAEAGRYDLVCIFEALHDMSQPREALEAARGALAPGGSVLVADERVADSFSAPGDEIERMMYGWSVSHCLPVALADQPSAALGTVLRAATLERLAADAGFDRVEVLPVENDFLRFYRLVP
jgi:2-polyprenyl-3-methyl-5-hydroxy-6-metoxy-1,4-benzoquinol methylase